MKILYPIGSFYPAQSGGPNNSIAWICRALQRHDVSSYVVSTSLDIDTDEIILNKWLKTSLGNVIYCKTFIHYFPIRLLISSILKIRKVDIIHLTGIFYPPSLIIFIVNKLFFGKPIIWSPRGELSSSSLIYSEGRKKIYLKLVKYFTDDQTLFHTTSPEETALVKSHFEVNNIIEIPNFIQLPKLFDHKPSFNYLLYLGRISPKKSIDKLLLALSLNTNFKNSGYKLLIVGNVNESPDYFQKLKDIIETHNLNDYVEFLGHKTGNDKLKIFSDAKFMILPSENENFGNVVVESLAQGTPVIASRGTPWQILNHKNAGFWVSNDPEVLSPIIDKIILMNNDEYQNYRCNALKLVSDRYDIDLNIKLWLKEYNNTMQH